MTDLNQRFTKNITYFTCFSVLKIEAENGAWNVKSQ